MILSYLFNSEIAEVIRHSVHPEQEIAKKYNTAIPLTNLVILSSFAYVIGYFLAFILSLYIGKNKPKFYWLNSLASLIIFWAMGWFGITGWNYLKIIFLTPGEFFNGVGYYLINGLLMVSIGIALLFVAYRDVANTNKEINAKHMLA